MDPLELGQSAEMRVEAWDRGLKIGAAQLEDWLLPFSSDWCLLYLCLWHALELWGKTGYGEDSKVEGVEQWSLSWVNRIQGVVAVKLKGVSLICSRTVDYSREIEFQWSWRQDPAEVLVPTCLICKKF